MTNEQLSPEAMALINDINNGMRRIVIHLDASGVPDYYVLDPNGHLVNKPIIPLITELRQRGFLEVAYVDTGMTINRWGYEAYFKQRQDDGSTQP
jgi:hypothetical protein